jgi:hypothetical protein
VYNESDIVLSDRKMHFLSSVDEFAAPDMFI